MKLHTKQETANRKEPKVLSNSCFSTIPAVEKNKQSIDSQTIRKRFMFLSRSFNPAYEVGKVIVPVRSDQVSLRSCLLHNNSDQRFWVAKQNPKYYTDLLQTSFSPETGEILTQSVYRTDDLTAGNNRKIGAVNRFCGHFKPLYQRRKVSMFFFTLTIANQAKVDIAMCVEALKKRLKKNKIRFDGLLWILEVSEESARSEGLHVHYHMLLTTERINWKGKPFPDYFKLENIWGCRTQVEAVKYDLKYYLSKYFSKNKTRIEGKRQYSCVIKKH